MLFERAAIFEHLNIFIFMTVTNRLGIAQYFDDFVMND